MSMPGTIFQPKIEPTNPNQPETNVKSNLVLALAAVALPMLAGNAFAGEKKLASGKCCQSAKATVNAVTAKAAPTANTLILNNRGEVIAVTAAPAR